MGKKPDFFQVAVRVGQQATRTAPARRAQGALSEGCCRPQRRPEGRQGPGRQAHSRGEECGGEEGGAGANGLLLNSAPTNVPHRGQIQAVVDFKLLSYMITAMGARLSAMDAGPTAMDARLWAPSILSEGLNCYFLRSGQDQRGRS